MDFNRSQRDLLSEFMDLQDPSAVFDRAVEVFSEFGHGALAHGVAARDGSALYSYNSSLSAAAVNAYSAERMDQHDYVLNHALTHTSLLVVDLAEDTTPKRAPLNDFMLRHGISSIVSQPVPVEGAVAAVSLFATSSQSAQLMKDADIAARFRLAAMMFHAAYDHSGGAGDEKPNRALDVHFVLTQRERATLARLARGDMVEDIADRFEISPGMVKRHIGKARRKLGARSRDHTVAIAVRLGLVSGLPDDSDIL